MNMNFSNPEDIDLALNQIKPDESTTVELPIASGANDAQETIMLVKINSNNSFRII